MFVDASALVAVLTEEPGWEELLARITAEKGDICISPLVRFETVLAVARIQAGRGGIAVSAATLSKAQEAVDTFLAEIAVENIDLTAETGTAALDAAQRYGKVVRHPARLNLGDCFAYACAKQLGLPLLYKGGDFARTDLA